MAIHIGLKMTANNDNRDLLKDLASDYAGYLLVDSNSEWDKFHNVVGTISSNVEEFSSLLESLELDTSVCVDSLLPQIAAQYERLKETFSQIDKLETVVKKVEKSVSAMEAEMNVAESHLGSESLFKLVLRPFLPKATTSTNSDGPLPSYTPVEIFKTEDLFSE